MKMEQQCCNNNDLALDKLLALRLKTIRRKKAIRSLLLRLLLTASIVYLLFGVVGGVGFVKGESMRPALFSGDIVLFFRLPSDYSHGDMVLLHEDGNYIKDGKATPVDKNATGAKPVLYGKQEIKIDPTAPGYSNSNYVLTVTVQTVQATKDAVNAVFGSGMATTQPTGCKWILR